MSRFRSYSDGTVDEPGGGSFVLKMILLAVVGIVALVLGVGALAWLFSFKGTDSGQVCVVREGGPFDGRAIKDVRQPGEGPRPIGAFNHQDCLSITERDSTDVVPDDQTFPTRDNVQVIADGLATWQLAPTKANIERFYVKYGRRQWDGHDLADPEGFLAFQRQRVAPVILDAQREVIGSYDCVTLNNLCGYVQNPDQAVKTGQTEGDGQTVTQNLTQANADLGKKIQEKLDAAFGQGTFENVRYQNFRARFEPDVAARVTRAQALRTDTANAKLEAEKKVAEAKGAAQQRIENARGEKLAAREQEKTYRLNPTKRDIDRIRAFCGPDGCDPQVIGGRMSDVIAGLSR